MGIHGLTGFIDKNPHLLKSHQLQDCSVVIDGNNFYHFLYYACHVKHRFGGDYDVYRRKVVSIFETLKTCGITPYVIFDGAYTVDGRKLKTSFDRAQMRINLVEIMNSSGRGKVLPILAYDTFIQTLTDLGVNHFTCQFEADNDVAVLANKLKCPVISNDSDFYIFDLVAGFLPLDYIDFKPSGKKNPYLPSEIYFVDKFLDSFDGLARPMLPVFASMLGNDFISASAFEAFYAKNKVQKVVSKQFSLPPKLSKVVSVLHWLNTHVNDFSEVIDQILVYIKPNRKSKVKRMFLASVNGYKDIEEFDGCDLHQFFITGQDNFEMFSHKDFHKYKGSGFPEWFLKAVCLGEITPSILNAAVLHRVILLTQVECIPFVTSYKCSEVLRRVQYGIFFKNFEKVCSSGIVNTISEDHFCSEATTPQENDDRTEKCIEGASASIHDVTASKSDGLKDEFDDEEEVLSEMGIDEDEDIKEQTSHTKKYTSASEMKVLHIEEFYRVRKSLRKVYLKPILSLGQMDVPSLEEIGFLSQAEKLGFLSGAMNVQNSFLESFAKQIKLFAGSLLVWIHNANPKVTENHLNTTIMCCILIHVHLKLASASKHKCTFKKKESASETGTAGDVHTPVSSEFKEIDISSVCQHQRTEELNSLAARLGKYYDKEPNSRSRSVFDPTIVHSFTQLQACLLDASNLNKVLRFPLPNLEPAQLINGTFMYNMCTEFSKRPAPDLFIASLLSEGSPIHQLFLKFREAILKQLQPVAFASPSVKVRSKSNKNKSKTKSKEPKLTAEEDDSIEEDSTCPGTSTVSGFDVSNKFSLLGLES